MCYTIFWRYFYEHMYMIRTHFCFYDVYTFLFTQFSQYSSYVYFYFFVYCLSTVFWCKYNMVCIPAPETAIPTPHSRPR